MTTQTTQTTQTLAIVDRYLQANRQALRDGKRMPVQERAKPQDRAARLISKRKK